MNIALLTFEGRNPEMYDESVVADELASLGATAEWVIWDELENPDAWDAIVFRSTWDYVEKLGKFRAFLERLRHGRARVLNSPDLILWNLSKSYLEELASEGIPTLPTLTLSGAVSACLARLDGELSSEKFVLKPQVSAGAYRTQIFSKKDRNGVEAYLSAGLAHSPVMAQPFVESIHDLGETSLIYFNSGSGAKLSHAVGKTPAAGDFRVQLQYGGITSAVDADPEMRAIGERLLARFQPRDWLYARVDLVNFGGRWCVIELEMIEPFLFLPYSPGSERRFAEAVVSQLG